MSLAPIFKSIDSVTLPTQSISLKYHSLNQLIALTMSFVLASLRGKVVWITGASSGIGEHLAYTLIRAGCKLVLSARRKGELERVKEACLNCK